MSPNEITVLNADKISKATGFSSEMVAIVKGTVAKGTTDAELAYFLSVASTVHLNPLNKEIWCYKDTKGNLLVFAGRDGFLKRAQESELWNGMTSFEVCENDVFEVDVAKGIVNHRPNFKDRGEIIGAYAIVKPKGCEYATVEWADIETYDKNQFTWNSHKADMIKKVAETHVLKKAFGITVLQSEYDYDVKGEVASVISHEEKTPLKIAQRKIIDGLETYQGEDKEAIQVMCAEKQKAGEFTVEFAQNIGKQIGLDI